MTNGFYNKYRYSKLKILGYLKANKDIRLLKEMNQASIFEIKKASVDLIWETHWAKSNEIFFQNAYYGLSYNIKKYINKDTHKPFNFNFEHGLYLGENYFSKWDLPKTTNTLLTFSDYRKSVLLNNNIHHKVYPIGPYIHYAGSFLKDFEFSVLKKELGKVLLVFPSHSTHQFVKEQNSDFKLLNFIKGFSREFNTVLVCLYWKDISMGYHKMYENESYLCVSAGHMFDFNFLNRLKAIIQLSDFTISNEVGTHIGYCINENKPHYIVNSKIDYIKDEGLHYADNYNNIKDVFSKEVSSITDKQIEIVNYYWGLEYKKTEEELSLLVEEINNNYKEIKNQKFNGLF